MSDDESGSDVESDVEERMMRLSEQKLQEEEAKKVPKKKRAPARRKKDKNAPKGACNAYTLFMKSKSKEVNLANPGMKPTEIMKIIGSMWKVVTPEEKAGFQGMADEDKARYKDEMSRYTPPDYSSDEGAPKKKKKKDKNAPKAAANAYSIFMKKKSKELQEALPAGEKPKDLFKTVGAMWKEVSAEEKAGYQAEATKDKERYKQEMDVYKAGKAVPAKEENVQQESDDDFEEEDHDPHQGSSHVQEDDEDGSGDDNQSDGDSDME